MKYVLGSIFLVLFFHIVLFLFYFFSLVSYYYFVPYALRWLTSQPASTLLRWCYFNRHILRSLYKFESRIQNFRKISFCHIKFYFLFFQTLFAFPFALVWLRGLDLSCCIRKAIIIPCLMWKSRSNWFGFQRMLFLWKVSNSIWSDVLYIHMWCAFMNHAYTHICMMRNREC